MTNVVMAIVVVLGTCHLWEIIGAIVGTADDRGRIVSGSCRWSCRFRFCIGRFFQLWTPRRLLILHGRFAAIGEMNGKIPVIFPVLGTEGVSIISARPASITERRLLP